jgi:hypothetical protein
VAFFGGDEVEGKQCRQYFTKMMQHEKTLAKVGGLCCIIVLAIPFVE